VNEEIECSIRLASALLGVSNSFRHPNSYPILPCLTHWSQVIWKSRGTGHGPCPCGKCAMALEKGGAVGRGSLRSVDARMRSHFAPDCPSPNRCWKTLALNALRARNLFDFDATIWGARDAGERGPLQEDLRWGLETGCHPWTRQPEEKRGEQTEVRMPLWPLRMPTNPRNGMKPWICLGKIRPGAVGRCGRLGTTSGSKTGKRYK
jgi:hypothetical protein